MKFALQMPARRVRGAGSSAARRGGRSVARRRGRWRRGCPSRPRADAGARGTQAASSSYEILAPPPPRAARERRPGDQPAGARTRGGGLAAACFLPRCLLCLVKTPYFLNCVWGPGFLSKSLGFTIPFPPSGRSTSPAQPRKCIYGKGRRGSWLLIIIIMILKQST